MDTEYHDEGEGMRNLPKTREYERNRGIRWTQRTHEQWAVFVDKADAMHDELLARIAELEANHQLAEADAADTHERLELAEATLAGRERMLEVSADDYLTQNMGRPPTPVEVRRYLRHLVNYDRPCARDEEGTKP